MRSKATVIIVRQTLNYWSRHLQNNIQKRKKKNTEIDRQRFNPYHSRIAVCGDGEFLIGDVIPREKIYNQIKKLGFHNQIKYEHQIFQNMCEQNDYLWLSSLYRRRVLVPCSCLQKGRGVSECRNGKIGGRRWEEERDAKNFRISFFRGHHQNCESRV